MQLFKTVLGEISEKDIGLTLSHEHICCYSEHLYEMAGSSYLDKERLFETSVKYLSKLKAKYGLNTFIDCTPVNIGRDVELLKRISAETKVNIICSTGFYYTEDPLLNSLDAELIADYIITDAEKVNVGIIKCAVENEHISAFEAKILKAVAKAQLSLNLPIVVHSNARNKNGIKALEILLQEGVKASAVTIGHLSDTDDLEYIKEVAGLGCYIGFDRIYNSPTKEYLDKTANKILELCRSGFEDKILLSHDALFFNGFQTDLTICEAPRFSFCFDNILPLLPEGLGNKLMTENPIKMLKCSE